VPKEKVEDSDEYSILRLNGGLLSRSTESESSWYYCSTCQTYIGSLRTLTRAWLVFGECRVPDYRKLVSIGLLEAMEEPVSSRRP
jgi:hypothetical protein